MAPTSTTTLTPMTSSSTSSSSGYTTVASTFTMAPTSTTILTPVTSSSTSSSSGYTVSNIGTTTINTQVTTNANVNSPGSASTTLLQMVTTSATSGLTTSVNTAITQTTTRGSSSQVSDSASNSPITTQSTILSTVITLTVTNLTLPVENLLNIKYANTTTHSWNFFNGIFAIVDNGCANNFLNVLLKTRWPDTLQSFFPAIENTSYFIPVGVTNTLPSGFTPDAGLYAFDTPSLKLPGKGACLKLFDISSDHRYNQACLSQPENCEYGFSAALWVKFPSDVLQNKDYLLTSGPEGVQGFKFYYSLGQLYIVITGRNTAWSASMPMKKLVGTWMIVGFSWRRFTGEIRLLVGDQFPYFPLTQSIHNLSLNPATTMYLGCICDLSGYSDSATTPIVSVGHIGFWLWPIRLQPLLTGPYVYQMIKDTPTIIAPSTTPSPVVTHDFSKDIMALVANISDPNPMYTTADEYIAVNNINVVAGQVDIETTGRKGFKLNGKGSKIDVTQIRAFTNSCPSMLSSCSNGLSLSLWLKLPNTTDSGDILEVVNNIRIVYFNQVTNILVYNGSNSFGKSTSLIMIGLWQNLGLSISLANGKLDVYINGIIDKSATVLNVSNYARGPSDTNVNNGDIVIGSAQSNSFVGVTINDICIWRRYLFHFESHRFVGYTQTQFSQLQNASNYWTTDTYINTDAEYQLTRMAATISAFNFSLASLLVPKSSSMVMDGDPFSKSKAQCPILEQKYTNYIFMGRSKILTTTYQDSDINWTGHCLTDPCQDSCRYSGFSLSMWLKIKSVSLTSTQFYFSSGDMANNPGAINGRGISMFTDQQLFGVSMSTCLSYWNIIIDANRYSINQWMNIGILWREDLGFKLIINGIDYGLINSIQDQIYKPQDLGFRAVSGRFDTDDQTQWQNNGYWQMANFVFGEMSYFNRYLSPDSYATIIGLVNNLYYADASLLRIGHTLINQPIADLLSAKTQNQSYNYEGVVQWNQIIGAVAITNGRVPILIDSNVCPTNINNCTSGFSVGGWFFISKNLTTALSTCYNIFIQGDLTTAGFGIQLCPNSSIYGWVNSQTLYSVMIPFEKFNANFNQWLFLGLIWQINNGLTVIINGNYFTSTTTSTGSVQVPSDKRLFVGDVKVNLQGTASLLVYNTVLYNYNLNIVQLQKFLGMQYNQVLLISKATFFWTAYGLYFNLITNQIEMTEVKYTSNKYDTSNAAICTAGSDQSFITLKSTTEHCLFNPDLCTSFVLIVNINFSPMMNPAQAYGFILTVGNNQTGIRGVSIYQTPTTVEILVRNSTTTCRSVMLNYTTGNWVQMKLLWSSLKNQIVKVDENTKVAAIDAQCVPQRNNISSNSDIILGRNPLNTTMSSKVCISEVMLMHINTTVDPDSQSSGLFSSSCYQNMDLIYPLNNSSVDQYQMPMGSSTLSSAIISDVLPESCLTNPSKCSNGLTVSFWVKIDQVSGTDIPLVTVGQIKRRGIGVFLSSGVNSSVFSISASLHSGTLLWSLKQDSVLAQSVWTNIGVTWNTLTGLNLFINGIMTKSSTTSSMTALADNSLPTKIEIGNTISGYIDNFAVWFKVVAYCQSPQASNKQLGGVCKTDPTIPVQVKCSIVVNCINISQSLCVDETVTNIIQLSTNGMKITSSSDANTILGIVYRVLQKTPPTTNLTMASVSLLLNVATNMIVTGPLTKSAATALIASFVSVNAELIQDKYQSDWSIMTNQTLYNPLLVIEAADNLYVQVSQQLSTLCSTVSITQGSLGVSLMKIDSRQGLCNATFPNYSDNVWTQNGSLWQNCQDSIALNPQSIQLNGPVISIASSIYFPTVILPLTSSPSVNSNGTLTLNINSKLVTLTTMPVLPRVVNQTLVTVQLQMVTPNVRPSKIMAWDIIDPSNPSMQFKWSASFWNNSLIPANATYGTWDNLGCTATTWNTTNIVFFCDHMTSFTVLMEPVVPSDSANLALILSYLSIVGCAISILCLLIFIITIAISKSLRGTRYIIHLNMSVALLVALLAFLLVQPAVQSQLFCQAVGVLMHLFFLAAFSWFLVEALYVFYAVTSGVVDGKFKCYVPIAWCVPIIIVGATAGLSLDSYGRNKFCWLSQTSVFLWAFLGPLIFLIVGTVVVSLIVACNIATPAIKGDVLDEARDNIKQTAIMIPFILIGWMFGIVYLATSIMAMAFLFVILCSLEGLWVLIFFGLMNPDFRYAICRRTRPRDAHESEAAILDKMEIDGSSQATLRGNRKGPTGPTPPPKMNAPVYYTSNAKSRPPRHMDSVESSRVSLNSERQLIGQTYRGEEYVEEVDTNTILNNGIPISFSRSIPGTPQYEE